MPKNQGVSLYCTLKTKKRIPFLTFTRRYENLRKVPLFLMKSRIFLGFVFDINWGNFLEYYLYLTNRKKAGKRNFSSFFSFLPLSLKSKKVDFFPTPFFVWYFWRNALDRQLSKTGTFFSFEYRIQIKILIFRPFSFSLSAFFAKSRIAGTDHWLCRRLLFPLLHAESLFYVKQWK